MIVDTTPPRTTGTTHLVEVKYIIYYGAASYRDRSRTFYDEHSAHKFFTEKLQANLHVSAYKEIVKTTRIVERI